jgi:transposase-like protein
MVLMAAEHDPDPTEVRRARRSWPASYKLAILAEIEEAKRSGQPGAVGAICRREGLYSSLISEWRKQRDDGALQGLAERPKGRPRKDRTTQDNARLRARIAELEQRVETLDELVDAQGKVSALLQQMSRKSAEQTREQP